MGDNHYQRYVAHRQRTHPAHKPRRTQALKNTVTEHRHTPPPQQTRHTKRLIRRKLSRRHPSRHP
jgi:hypothetical protein